MRGIVGCLVSVQLYGTQPELLNAAQNGIRIGIDKDSGTCGRIGKIVGSAADIARRGGMEDESHHVDAEPFYCAYILRIAHAAYLDYHCT